jgi:hypothetical protein
MKRIAHALLTLALAGMAGSCMDTGPTGPRAGDQVKVALGRSVRVPVAGPRTILTFDRVVSDSRCPMGALCFIAGEAVVELTVSDGTQSERFLLKLSGMEGDSESSAPPVAALGHRFQLFRLDPYPAINVAVGLLPPPVVTVIFD